MWSSKHRGIAAILLVVLIVAAGCAAALLLRQDSGVVTRRPEEPSQTSGTEAEERDDEDWSRVLLYNGRRYRRNPDLQTILLLGVDESVSVSSGGELDTGGRADAILLLIMDRAQETLELLEISRDTIMTVDAYDHTGKKVFSGPMHLNMQYAFSDSPTRSCWLMKNKVSELLYGISVDGCVSLTMDGFQKLVDAMGGLSLVMPEDWSEVDPAYTKGSEVHLDGAAAREFMRRRDTEHSGGNNARMSRQSWLMGYIFQHLKDYGGVAQLTEWMNSVSTELTSDVSAETLKEMTSYQWKDSQRVPGTVVLNGVLDEFHVDEAALKELLVALFYLPEGGEQS